MSFFWHVSPIAIQIAGLEIRWYGILFAISFLVAYRILIALTRCDGMTPRHYWQILFSMVVSTVVGGRLGHCFFYHAASTWENPLSLFALRNGGNSSHGVAVASIACMAFYARYQQWSIRWFFDRLCIPIPLVASAVRLGNFMNSEILGVPTSSHWGVIFTRVDSIPRHPVVLYEAIANLFVFAVLFSMQRTPLRDRRGTLFGTFLLLLFGARFILEWFKETPLVSASIPFTTGQLLSLPCVILGLVILAFPTTFRKGSFDVVHCRATESATIASASNTE